LRSVWATGRSGSGGRGAMAHIYKKILKTWHRSRMTEERLLALCLIDVYHEVDVLNPIDHIIDIFASSKNRRLKFVL